MRLAVIADPIDLSEAATKILSSSNFRFVWQFHRIEGLSGDAVALCRNMLDAIVADPALHRFLRSSMDDIYPRDFAISSLHEHCQIRECTEDFIDVFARAVFDHLGAYSRQLRPATPDEKNYATQTFSSLGNFSAYSIFPGDRSDCDECRQYNHQLWSNWFFDVAWDFTFFVVWPEREIVWIGCLSDTD